MWVNWLQLGAFPTFLCPPQFKTCFRAKENPDENPLKNQRKSENGTIQRNQTNNVKHVCINKKVSTNSFRFRSISSRPGSRGPSNDIYASLPRSLKTELQVRSMQEGDNETLKERRALVESKSPAELGQIHSFSEIPVPRMVEAWLHSSESKKG